MPRGLAIALCHRVVSLVSVTCAACIVIMMKWCCVHCDASLNRCRHTLSGIQLLFSVTTFFSRKYGNVGEFDSCDREVTKRREKTCPLLSLSSGPC